MVYSRSLSGKQRLVAERLFIDRADAGRRLAAAFSRRLAPDPIVVGLSRGGVIVAAAFSAVSSLQLEVYVARKLGAPGNPDLAVS